MATSLIRATATVVPGAVEYEHDCDRGFCTVCGSVWPCARAERAARTGRPRVADPLPVSRTLPALLVAA